MFTKSHDCTKWASFFSNLKFHLSNFQGNNFWWTVNTHVTAWFDGQFRFFLPPSVMHCICLSKITFSVYKHTCRFKPFLFPNKKEILYLLSFAVVRYTEPSHQKWNFERLCILYIMRETKKYLAWYRELLHSFFLFPLTYVLPVFLFPRQPFQSFLGSMNLFSSCVVKMVKRTSVSISDKLFMYFVLFNPFNGEVECITTAYPLFFKIR